MIIYYTDGSCSPNPGPGGFAVIKNMQPALVGHEKESTNIRMEGQALIAALNDAAGQECVIHTDSEFWINVITKWALAWEKNGWKKKGGEIKNLELVQEVYSLYAQANATLTWVRGHNEDEGNELADKWANKARAERLTEVGVTVEDALNEKQLVVNYLQTCKIMQLATVSEAGPWICTVHFIADDAQNIFWLSLPSRKHSQHVEKQPQTAVAIAVKTDKPVIGIQARGCSEEVKDIGVVEEVMKRYVEKYAMGGEFYDNFIKGKNQHKLYKFTPELFQLFDELHFEKGETPKQWELE